MPGSNLPALYLVVLSKHRYEPAALGENAAGFILYDVVIWRDVNMPLLR